MDNLFVVVEWGGINGYISLVPYTQELQDEYNKDKNSLYDSALDTEYIIPCYIMDVLDDHVQDIHLLKQGNIIEINQGFKKVLDTLLNIVHV